ncbi:unnamed protein product, partial [Sphacelaria rigidula]
SSRVHRASSGASADSSAEWGAFNSGGDEGVMDADECFNLWAAFMEPDSPPGSPSLTSSASLLEDDDDDDKGNVDSSSRSRVGSSHSLSALLSGASDAVDGGDDSDGGSEAGEGGGGADDNDNSEGVNVSPVSPNGLLPPPPPLSPTAKSSSVVVKKEELIADAADGHAPGGGGGGVGGHRRSAAFKLFPGPSKSTAPTSISAAEAQQARSTTTTTTTATMSQALRSGASTFSPSSPGSGAMISAKALSDYGAPRAPMPPPSPAATAALNESADVVTGRIGSESMTPGALRAAQNAAASELAAAVERRGFTGDAIKRARFNEFISGFLSVSVFHAADVWLPLAAGSGHHGGPGAAGGNDGTPRLFVFSSDVKDPRLAKWSTLSRNVVLASGVGVPGLVFQERRSQWAV